MNSKHIRADLNMAYPTGEIAVMGQEGAVNILYKREIAAADDPEVSRQEKIDEYRERFANPYVAAARGYVDQVIDPADTRARIIEAFRMAEGKREDLPAKKHGNIPL
jgi:acetyl-CoA/propionyl-CoA carboxylase carboxyl transferase subunit